MTETQFIWQASKKLGFQFSPPSGAQCSHSGNCRAAVSPPEKKGNTRGLKTYIVKKFVGVGGRSIISVRREDGGDLGSRHFGDQVLPGGEPDQHRQLDLQAILQGNHHNTAGMLGSGE